VSELRADQKVLLILVLGLGVLGIFGLGWLGGTHLPRVFLALLAVGVGLATSISFARRQRWFTRLGWMAGGLALAGLAGWFVPTTGGVSLWSAYRQVEELRTLPAGEVAAFNRGAVDRRQVAFEFPAFAPDLAAGEQAWLRRTADEAIEDADRLCEADPHEASAGLQRLCAALARTDRFDLVRGELLAARKRALLAQLKAAQVEAEELIDAGEWAVVARRGAFWADQLADEAKALGAEAEVNERLTPLRRKAVQARLEVARKEIARLLREDRFEAVADAGAKLARDAGDDARAVGLGDDLDRVCQGCAVFGDLARQAKKQVPR
jgi:hypothetical protein